MYRRAKPSPELAILSACSRIVSSRSRTPCSPMHTNGLWIKNVKSRKFYKTTLRMLLPRPQSRVYVYPILVSSFRTANDDWFCIGLRPLDPNPSCLDHFCPNHHSDGLYVFFTYIDCRHHNVPTNSDRSSGTEQACTGAWPLFRHSNRCIMVQY